MQRSSVQWRKRRSLLVRCSLESGKYSQAVPTFDFTKKPHATTTTDQPATAIEAQPKPDAKKDANSEVKPAAKPDAHVGADVDLPPAVQNPPKAIEPEDKPSPPPASPSSTESSPTAAPKPIELEVKKPSEQESSPAKTEEKEVEKPSPDSGANGTTATADASENKENESTVTLHPLHLILTYRSVLVHRGNPWTNER